MAQQKLNFLVLTNFSEGSNLAIEHAIILAKTVNGVVHVLHVSNTGEAVTSENPVVALREINYADIESRRKLRSITKIIQAEGIECSFQHRTGNLISELQEQLLVINPDVVVVGNSKPKGIIQQLLNKKSTLEKIKNEIKTPLLVV